MKIDLLEKRIRLFRYRLFRNPRRDLISINVFNINRSGLQQTSTDINGSFLFSQIILDIILRSEISPKEKEKFVRTFAQKYKNSTPETKILEDFNKYYREQDVFEWYTEGTFIFQLLNKAFRIQDIDSLFLFRFFIRDLKKQLELHRCTEPVHVYRGQLMSKNELAHLKQSVGQIISMNSFISTSLSKDVALHLIGMTDVNDNPAPDDLEYILFEIDADPEIGSDPPAFANISDYSPYDEEEILFIFSSLFRLTNIHVDPINPKLTIVSMTLCGNDEHELKTVLETMKKEYRGNFIDDNSDSNEQTLIPLSMALINMGYFKSAKTLLTQMLRTLQRDPKSVDAATCCRYIGDVCRQENRFKTSRMWYRKALKMYERILPSNHVLIAITHLCLGHAYSKTTDWNFPTWYRTDFASEFTYLF